MYFYYYHTLKKILPKKLTELDKQEIIRNFISGETIQQLSEKYNFSKITVSRHLKKNIGVRKIFEVGLNWVFKYQNEIIILEDDVVPAKSFLKFS